MSLDYRKAFDLVDHTLLVAKLYSLGVKPTVVNWVADFLTTERDPNVSSSDLTVSQSSPQTPLGFHKVPVLVRGSFWTW